MAAIYFLLRAVDRDGELIDILVQSHRDSKAAERFFRRILRVEGTLPRRVITERLRGYGIAMRMQMPGVEHIKDKGANNRAENAQQPTRQRERAEAIPIQVGRISITISFQFFND
jgi:putative transposase